MVKSVLVGFLPDYNQHNCEMHPYGCGNALLEREGNGMGRLVCLHLVDNMHRAGYEVKHICFAAVNIQMVRMEKGRMVACCRSPR
jgi:hypothetical protein